MADRPNDKKIIVLTGGQRKEEKPKGKFRGDQTISHIAYDPNVKKLDIQSSPKMVAALVKRLSEGEIVQAEAMDGQMERPKFDLPHYLGSVKGGRPIPVEGASLILTRSENRIVIISDKIPATLYDIWKGIVGDVKLKEDECFLWQHKKTGKRRYLINITYKDWVGIRRALSKKREKERVVARKPITTLKPKIKTRVEDQAKTEEEDLDVGEFKKKLAEEYEDAAGTAGGLTMEELIKRIVSVDVFEDEDGTPHYFIITEDSKRYRLYVDAVNAMPYDPDSYESITTFGLKSEEYLCALCLEGKINLA